MFLPVLRIRIRDPGNVPFWPLDPGSWIRDGRKSASGSVIRDPGWTIRIIFFRAYKPFFLLFWGLKYSNSLMRIRDPGWRQFGSGIRDGKKSDPGSGINIPDPQHWNVEWFENSDPDYIIPDPQLQLYRGTWFEFHHRWRNGRAGSVASMKRR